MYTTDVHYFVCRLQLLTGSMTAMRRALWAGKAKLGHQAVREICTLLYRLYTVRDWCHDIAAQASIVKPADDLQHVAEHTCNASLRGAACAYTRKAVLKDNQDSLIMPEAGSTAGKWLQVL